MSDLRFISIDGNNIGKRIEQYILSERFDALKEFSNGVSSAIEDMTQFIAGIGGRILMSGGDNLLATVPWSKYLALKCFFDEVQARGVRFSIGVGRNARASFLALKYAKSTETDCVVYEDTFPESCI